MKKFFCFLFVALSLTKGFSQNIGINATGAAPHASAMLDVVSTTKGILIPRMTSAQRIAIVSPATGLQVYDTDNNSCWFYNGSSWMQLSIGSNGWNLTGNAGINPANNFIGTTDNQPLRFKVNNSKAGEINPTTGNVFFGLEAGASNSSGSSNTAIGTHSLFSNTDGYNNAANGNYALNFNTTGFENTANGSSSLFFNTTGSSNTGNGTRTLYNNTTGSFNTTTGADALLSNNTGSYNTANGYQALFSNTIGYSNTANGSGALYFNSTGVSNTASGGEALKVNTTGNNNSGHGSRALFSNSTGNNNTATGEEALLSNFSGNNNTANGHLALASNTTGNYNTADGEGALYSNVYGVGNTASGYNALNSNTVGIQNTAIGVYALSNNTGGNNNIAIGVLSGTHPNTPNLFNTVSIGNDGLLNAYQNQVFIGNNSTGFIGGKVNWGIVSDARIKNTVMEDVKGLEFIMRLRPVTYHISNHAMTAVTGNRETPDFPGKYDGEKVKYTGFIAQEVEQAAKAANYEFSGYEAPKNQWSLYTLRYAEFVVPLVKAMQEQQKIIEEQKTELNDLKKRLVRLEEKIK